MLSSNKNIAGQRGKANSCKPAPAKAAIRCMVFPTTRTVNKHPTLLAQHSHHFVAGADPFFGMNVHDPLPVYRHPIRRRKHSAQALATADPGLPGWALQRLIAGLIRIIALVESSGELAFQSTPLPPFRCCRVDPRVTGFFSAALWPKPAERARSPAGDEVFRRIAGSPRRGVLGKNKHFPGCSGRPDRLA